MTIGLGVALLLACSSNEDPTPAKGAGGAGGAGGTTSSAECEQASDCPGEDSDCSTVTCEQGACGVAYAEQGSSCDEEDGKVCDGAGSCVGCNEPSDCDSGVCTDGKCADPSCSDNIKNGDEIDIDCGGSCDPCGSGKDCSGPADCDSGVCTDGKCAKPTCGDSVKNGGETDVDCGGKCDPCANGSSCGQHADCASAFCDTMAGSCRLAVSCLELLNAGIKADGAYQLDLDGDGGPMGKFVTNCDMTTDGGGWTEITPYIARIKLDATLAAEIAANTAGFDAAHHPCTRDDGVVNHVYHYTIPFPPGFTAFYLNNYEIRGNASGNDTADLGGDTFLQTDWKVGFGNAWGDVSFGAAENPGPTTSFGAHIKSQSCSSCSIAWPPGAQVFSLQGISTAFRIGWGEDGSQNEGWCGWWSGSIRLR